MRDLIAEIQSGQRQHRRRLETLLEHSDGIVRVASPYVTDTDLLAGLEPRNVRLLTSLSTMDIITRATSLDSLRVLIKSKVRCRCATTAQKLHAKVYIFGDKTAVVTSANLTRNALDSNIEVGVRLNGSAVSKLKVWFDALWEGRARALTLQEISRLKRKTEKLRSEYDALKRKAKKSRPSRIEFRAEPILRKQFHFAFSNKNRFFVCNTDRKWSEVAEQRMRQRGYAAAWTTFRHPSHMEAVEPGDTIFMYAKGAGIVAVGRATSKCKKLRPDDSDRLRTEHKRTEWRIPVKWLAWEDDDAAAVPHKPLNATFYEVSDNRALRRRVEQRIAGRLLIDSPAEGISG